jgi:hypothetical protein
LDRLRTPALDVIGEGDSRSSIESGGNQRAGNQPRAEYRIDDLSGIGARTDDLRLGAGRGDGGQQGCDPRDDQGVVPGPGWTDSPGSFASTLAARDGPSEKSRSPGQSPDGA